MLHRFRRNILFALEGNGARILEAILLVDHQSIHINIFGTPLALLTIFSYF